MRKTFNIMKILILSIVIFFIGDNTVFLANNNTENDNINKKMPLSDLESKQKQIAMAEEKEKQKKLYIPVNSFTGHLTGYSADCAGCSGNLSCTGTNVKTNGVYYNDKKYGKVRIIATSSSIPCGTIMKFDLPSISNEPIVAIALDKGVPENTVDLLVESHSYAINYVGSLYNKKFDVLRLGW